MRYSTNKLFKPKRVGKAFYIEHQNGARVRTDRLVNFIWSAAQGLAFSDIRKKLRERALVSDLMLKTTLHLMVEAGLLEVDESYPVVSPQSHRSTTGPRVSIIIVNKDGVPHLKTLLPSLVGQEYQNIEIIMVDNNSKDDSVSLIKQYFVSAKVVALPNNIGFAGGNNVGIKEATGEYLFLLNNDTELAPDCVSRLVAAAEGKQDLGAIVPKMYLWSLPKIINAIGNSVWPRGWGTDNYIGYLDIGQFDDISEVFSACFGAVMISRKALDKVGLLDSKYRFYYEDADWSYRARSAGFKIYFAPLAKVYHKFNASMKELQPNFKWQLVIGNRLRFVTKNMSKGTWLNFMRNYVKEDIRAFLRSVKHGDAGMAWTYFRAWLRFIMGLPGILIARSRIQRQRTLKDAELFKAWPDLPPLLDKSGHPILDMATIRRIYLHYLPDAMSGWSSTASDKEDPTGAVSGK